MPGGRDARRLYGQPNPPRPDDYGRNGSPSYTKQTVGSGGIRRPLDELERAYAAPVPRYDHYSDRGPSEASGGPRAPRKSARSFEDSEFKK